MNEQRIKSESKSPAPSLSSVSMGEPAAAIRDIKLEDSPNDVAMTPGISDDNEGHSRRSSTKMKSRTGSPAIIEDVKSTISVKQESENARPRLHRTSSQKVPKRQPPIFNHLPDSTEEAKSTFVVIERCTYSSKWLGDSGQDGEIMSCECSEEWDGTKNRACGENSDCINRMTSMECTVENDCGCGDKCQNQRFQLRQYANVSVIKTEKKGFGLRTDSDLIANQFIYEYVGEVIDENKFRRRMQKYDSKGIKHFYFMSLGKNEFVDATEKGGLGRFCNHSCNPNCYVDKWVVGEKLRMGIFAKRSIKAGEELVFDYNVDRYGAEPQPCYCGEPNCLGYIGGKTQTDTAPKLSHNIIEALGLEDADGWSTATAAGKKVKRPKKNGEADEEYVENVQTKPLREAEVTKVMSSLLHTKEKWIISKLLSRIQLSDEETVFARVVKMHGYQIIGRILAEYKQDDVIVLMALDILMKFPRITKNKITSSKIEPAVQELANSENDKVRDESAALLKVWSSLETGFRIPRRIGGAAEPRTNAYNDRDNRDSRSQSESPRRPPTPTRPRVLARPTFQQQPPRGPRADRERQQERPQIRNNRELPWGWHKAWHEGQMYYYANDGRTRWEQPTESCQSNERLPRPPPPPPAPGTLPLDPRRNDLQQIINRIADEVDIKRAQKEELARKREEEKALKEAKEKEERRRRRREKEAAQNGKVYDDEKTKMILLRSFAKVVPNIVSKYEVQLGGREEVKRVSKEIAGLLVNKEMKDGRKVVNPHLLLEGEKGESKKNKIKGFVKPYVEKVIQHNRGREKRRAERNAADEASRKPGATPQSGMNSVLDMSPIADAVKSLSPDTPAPGSQPSSPGSNKRKRGSDDMSTSESPKRVKSPSPNNETGSTSTSISPEMTTPAVSSINTDITRPPTSASPPSSSKRRRESDDEEYRQGNESPKRARNFLDAEKTPTTPPAITERVAKTNGVSVC